MLQSPLEQTYHIFYYVRSAALLKDERTIGLQLDTAESFEYLQEIQTPEAESSATRAHHDRFQTLIQTMEKTGFDETLISGILKTMSLVLNLGNVKFKVGDDDGARVQNPEQVSFSTHVRDMK